MRPDPAESESLRLAAKAADRAKAAETLRPAFEERLKHLGHSSRATAHAFSALTGPATVEEVLAELDRNERLERTAPVPLDFEVVECEPALPDGYSLTITGVQRDGLGIHVTYEIQPPLPSPAEPPRVEARDDRAQEYRDLGGAIGLAGPPDHTITRGFLTFPDLPAQASQLHVHMSWSASFPSLRQGPACELRIAL